MHRHLEVVVGPEDALAEVALLVGLFDCRLDPASRFWVLATDVDEGVMHLVGDRGDDDPLDHLVGVPLQKLAVLERARL